MDTFHLKAIFWITIYGVSAGIFLISKNPILIVVGILCLLLDVFYEYYFLREMDTRDDVQRAKKQLKSMLNEAKSLQSQISGMVFDLDSTKKEIQEMSNKIFDVFSSNGFKTVEERIKSLEEICKDIEEMKKVIEKINGTVFGSGIYW